ncbi:MAG: 4-hydroxybenzoate octaprenyltransferase [Planctomycetota bacterium]|nr:MAG: 4-hydroxybenzoate octaprenyltransferase [Planctomycetota bacterium]
MIANPQLSANEPAMTYLTDNAHASRRLTDAVTASFSDIKLAHTVFALPFAVLGSVLATARDGVSRGDLPGILALVVLCMIFARTWAMLVNRIADRRFDAANPRTAGRALASGRVAVDQAGALALASAAAFLACCFGYWFWFANPWPALLGVPTLAWIALYSFTKRFTWLSHVFLGGALAASPLAAAIATRPGALADTPALWWIAAMVLVWVAGFDALYALQDLDFDRRAGLRSLPARFGWAGAVRASRALHLGAVACLALAWRAEPTLGGFFAIGVAAVAALLALEHAVVATRGLAGLPIAFFTVNGVVSVALGGLGVADVLL